MQTLTNKLIDAYGATLRADAQELLDAAKTIYKLKEWDAVAEVSQEDIDTAVDYMIDATDDVIAETPSGVWIDSVGGDEAQDTPVTRESDPITEDVHMQTTTGGDEAQDTSVTRPGHLTRPRRTCCYLRPW